MVSHLYCFATIHTVRGIAGLGVAGLFLYYSDPERVPSHPMDLTISRYHNLEAGDSDAFLFVGCILVAIALVRLVFAYMTFLALRGGASRERRLGSSILRRFGLVVAVVDLVDLTLFPITTACGLYGWLLFRHSDTRALLDRRLASV